MKQRIKCSEIAALSNATLQDFPKYTTMLINQINGVAQGTRPKIVGQMSELIQEFDGRTLQDWIKWYDERYPNAVDDATDRIYAKYLDLRKAMDLIDKDMIRAWVEDLVYNKTYCGLKFQRAIITYMAVAMDKTCRPATPKEEAMGIDGFIGDKPVQIKSASYKLESRLQEFIDVPIVYYHKKAGGDIEIEYEEGDFL